MQIRKSAQTVADHLFAAEAAIDEAIRASAALVGSLPAARLDSNLSAVIGQEAFNGAGRVIAVLTDARAELVRTHGALDQIKDRIGLRHVSLGGAEKEIDMPAEGRLTVVGERRRA